MHWSNSRWPWYKYVVYLSLYLINYKMLTWKTNLIHYLLNNYILFFKWTPSLGVGICMSEIYQFVFSRISSKHSRFNILPQVIHRTKIYVKHTLQKHTAIAALLSVFSALFTIVFLYLMWMFIFSKEHKRRMYYYSVLNKKQCRIQQKKVIRVRMVLLDSCC